MQEISEKMGNYQYARVNVCCMDCKRKFAILMERTGPNKIEIKNGAIYKTKNEYEFKCPTCFENNPNHGPKVEVYSRVVGYLRPVSNWNPGKQDEYKMRKVFEPLPVGPVETQDEMF